MSLQTCSPEYPLEADEDVTISVQWTSPLLTIKTSRLTLPRSS